MIYLRALDAYWNEYGICKVLLMWFYSLLIFPQNNYELRSELDNSKFDLKESKGYLSEVQGQIKKEKRERAQ